MLCFKFFSGDGITLGLCEEIIRYSAYREEGIEIGVVLTVKVPEGGGTFFAVHRRVLEECELATPEEWQEGDGAFPYLYIFAHLIPDRFVMHADGEGDLRLLRGKKAAELELLHVQILTGDAEVGLTKAAVVPEDLMAQAPFTCLQFGPFPKKGGSFALAFRCRIGEPTFGDLVPEDETTGTRRYRVYGPKQIDREIRMLDLPNALSLDERYGAYADQFDKLDKMCPVVPDQYSIVAVDNPNCNPDELRCLNMSENLVNATQLVDPKVYAHPALDSIVKRIHWFLCNNAGEDFYLQLSGPMAFAGIPQ